MNARNYSLRLWVFMALMALAAGGCRAGQLEDPDDGAQESQPTALATAAATTAGGETGTVTGTPRWTSSFTPPSTPTCAW